MARLRALYARFERRFFRGGTPCARDIARDIDRARQRCAAFTPAGTRGGSLSAVEVRAAAAIRCICSSERPLGQQPRLAAAWHSQPPNPLPAHLPLRLC
jgi:hypothetical protein